MLDFQYMCYACVRIAITIYYLTTINGFQANKTRVKILEHFLKVPSQYLTIHVTDIMFAREECVIEPGHTSTTHVGR